MEVTLELLTQIILNVPNYVFWKDNNLVYRGANHNFAKNLGCSSVEQLIGKTDYEIPSTQAFAHEYQIEDRHILHGGEPILGKEVQLKVANAKNRILSVSKVPLYGDHHNIIGVLGIYIDITHIKENEALLSQAKERAEDASRAKSEFIANISHDLRTPLTGILGETQMLKGQVSELQRMEYVEDLEKCANKLLLMYNEIIEAVSSGQMTEKNIEKSTFDISVLAKDIKDLHMPMLKSKGLDFKMEISPDIPTFLTSDRSKIERIIENLLGNAIKFTKNGCIHFNITMLLKQENIVKIRFNVIDTGIGIPESSKLKLFERFYKVSPSYKEKYQGVGLGLDIAQNYTHLLGGTIGFNSTEDVGSDFYVILPLDIATKDEIDLCKKEHDEKTTLLKRRPDSSQEFHIQQSKDAFAAKPFISRGENIDSPCVLVIEDNPIALMMAVNMVKNQKLNVTQAENGEVGLELAKHQRFDLILADVGLPGISGIEVTKLLRSFEKEQGIHATPIVGVTAHAAGSHDECIIAGMSAVTQKPLTSKILNEIIETFLPDFKVNHTNKVDRV